MVEVPSGRPSVTWDELTAKNPEVTEDWEADGAYRREDGDSHSLELCDSNVLVSEPGRWSATGTVDSKC